MLRNEAGIYYEDLYPLIAFLPRFAYESDWTEANNLLPLWRGSHNNNVAPLTRAGTQTPSRATTMNDADTIAWSVQCRSRDYQDYDPEKVLPVVHADRPLRPSRMPPETGFFDYFPILRPIKRIRMLFKPKQVEAYEDEDLVNPPSHGDCTYLHRKKRPPIDSNVPLQIMLYINSYNDFLLKEGLITAPAGTVLANFVSALDDAISGLDRIKTTPLPFAYQAHLRMTLWCEPSYLLFRCG